MRVDVFRATSNSGQVLDATGNKGTGKMTIREGARLGVACSTMSAALDARFLAFNVEERQAASKILKGSVCVSAIYSRIISCAQICFGVLPVSITFVSARMPSPSSFPEVKREQLVADIRDALYCSKICSYAQGMNLIKEASNNHGWGVDLGEAARIWKAGCIIRAQFLDRIKSAYERNPALASLLVDADFAQEINDRQDAWRRVVTLSCAQGATAAAMSASLAFYDQYVSQSNSGRHSRCVFVQWLLFITILLTTVDDFVHPTLPSRYRRARLPANLVQAQRDFFGSHTFERTDEPRGEAFHCLWDESHNASTGQ